MKQYGATRNKCLNTETVTHLRNVKKMKGNEKQYKIPFFKCINGIY